MGIFMGLLLLLIVCISDEVQKQKRKNGPKYIECNFFPTPIFYDIRTNKNGTKDRLEEEVHKEYEKYGRYMNADKAIARFVEKEKQIRGMK